MTNRLADTPMMRGPQFFTAQEIAKILRVSKMTVYRLVHSKEIHAVQIGRSFRIPARSFNEYLTKQGLLR